MVLRGALARPLLAAPVLGLLAATAFAPIYFWPGLLAFAGLVHLMHERPGPWWSALLGLLFGLPFFLAGLYWVGIAFFADAERFGALAVPAVLLLCLGLALFVAVAAGLTSLVRWRSVEARGLAFAFAWTVSELVREHGPQFPWNPVAAVWAGSDWSLQGVAWLGNYGLSFVTVAAAGLAAGALRPHRRHRWLALGPAIALTLGLLGAGALRLQAPDPGVLPGVRMRLVQANIPQADKWQAELRRRWFERHLELSQLPAEAAPSHIVWPESAVPYQIEREPLVRDYLNRVRPPGGFLLTGGDRYLGDAEDPTASNSLFAIGEGGAVVARYDKVDLVPFGEFLPFRSILSGIGLRNLTQGSFDFTPGPGRQTVAIDGLPPFSPLICYEAIFPGRATAEPRPAWLLNITNDGWFGTSSGPYQHLAMARMRAVEEGLPLVRAANTGISVVTDAYGRITARLALNTAGVLDAPLPRALPEPSLARRLGASGLAVLLTLGLAAAALLERSTRARNP